MRLRNVDLNLFYVFDAVMKHRSVSRASAYLALSPSAVSHALTRLRQVLKDELFVRNDGGLQPTRRALELASRVSSGLLQFERALAVDAFVPAESIRCFRLSADDFFTSFALPHLVQRLGRAAPFVDLQVSPANRTDVARQLEAQTIDVVVGWFDALPSSLRRELLVRETGAFVVRAGHPLTKESPTLARLLEFPQLVVDFTSTGTERGGGFAEERGMLRRVRMERLLQEARNRRDRAARIALTVPYFASVPPILRVSDYVASLPFRFATWAVANGGLVLLDPTLEQRSIDIELVWHSRDDDDAGLRWFLDEVKSSVAAARTAIE